MVIRWFATASLPVLVVLCVRCDSDVTVVELPVVMYVCCDGAVCCDSVVCCDSAVCCESAVCCDSAVRRDVCAL